MKRNNLYFFFNFTLFNLFIHFRYAVADVMCQTYLSADLDAFSKKSTSVLKVLTHVSFLMTTLPVAPSTCPNQSTLRERDADLKKRKLKHFTLAIFNWLHKTNRLVKN